MFSTQSSTTEKAQDEDVKTKSPPKYLHGNEFTSFSVFSHFAYHSHLLRSFSICLLSNVLRISCEKGSFHGDPLGTMKELKMDFLVSLYNFSL